MPMVLTERDRGILRTVAEYGVLATDHLHAMCFPSASRARKRLRRLWQHKFLNRHVRRVRMGDGSAALLYTLDRASRAHLGGNGHAGAQPSAKRRVSLSDHALSVTDFRVALALALRRRDGLRLMAWRPGSAFRFQPSVQVRERNTIVPIIPDAFFTLTADGRDFNYCLEIDRGTTDLGRIRTKFLAYLNLWQSRAASAKLGILSFRILYVTTTEKRLAHMVDVVRSLRAPQRRLDLINLTCFGRYSLSHPARLYEPIWQTIAVDNTTQHTRPFPVAAPSKLPIVPGKPPVSEPEVGAR